MWFLLSCSDRNVSVYSHAAAPGMLQEIAARTAALQARSSSPVYTSLSAEVVAVNGGAALTESQRQELRRATQLIVSCEGLEGEIPTEDLRLYALLSQQLGRAFTRLGLQRGKQKKQQHTAPSLLTQIEQQRERESAS